MLDDIGGNVLVKILFSEEKYLSFEQYDFLLGVVTGQKKILSGKSTNAANRNAKGVGVLGVIMIIFGIILWLVRPEKEEFFHNILVYVAFSVGVLSILASLILLKRFKNEYRRIKQIVLNKELIFDQSGIRIGGDKADSFAASWKIFRHCFIGDTLIVFLFKHEKRIVYLPFSEEMEKKVIEGLKEGRKEEFITYIEMRKGRIYNRMK